MRGLVNRLFFLLFCSWQLGLAASKPFVFIIASYNNELWCECNLESVFTQEYDNYRVIYTDDCSTDSTCRLVKTYVAKYGYEDKVTLICNSKRMGHLHNHYEAIHTCKNNEIIIILDGDDWLAHNKVLSYLNEIYANPNVWLTYGQFKELSDGSEGYCKPFPRQVIESHDYRTYRPWIFGHTRTFYAGLFKRIKKEDLLYNGAYFPMAVDVATMFPMAEMAGNRVLFIPELLYIHNDLNPLNLKKVWQMQAFYENVIRNRPHYKKRADYCSAVY